MKQFDPTQLDLLKANLHATIDSQFDRFNATVSDVGAPDTPPVPPQPSGIDPLAGYAQIPVVPGWEVKLKTLYNAQVAVRIVYLYGGKDPTPLAPESIDYTGIDCSGEIRELFLEITNGAFDPGDGSQHQGDFINAYRDVKGQRLKPSTKDALGEMDGRLRVVVYRVKAGVPVGHIFFVLNGVTYESYGSHGVGSRAWNDPTIQAVADEIHVLCDKAAA